jgi:hypothetical protein
MRHRTILFVIDSNTTAFPANTIEDISPSDRKKQYEFRSDHGLHAKRVLMPDDLRREIVDALRSMPTPSEPLGILERVMHFYGRLKPASGR